MHTTCSVCTCYLSVCFQADNLILDHPLVWFPGEDCFSWWVDPIDKFPLEGEWGIIKDIWVKAKFIRLNKEAEVRGRLWFLLGSGPGCCTKTNDGLSTQGLSPRGCGCPSSSIVGG